MEAFSLRVYRIRTKRGCGIEEAKQAAKKEEAMERLENAKTVADLVPVLAFLVSQVVDA